jgi:hypothetical protein
MAYERCTPMHAYERCAYKMAAYERHAYEMGPVRSMSMRDAPMGDVSEMVAYERHVYEMAPVWKPSRLQPL